MTVEGEGIPLFSLHTEHFGSTLKKKRALIPPKWVLVGS